MPTAKDYITPYNMLSILMAGRWPAFLMPEGLVIGEGAIRQPEGRKRVNRILVESRVSQIIEGAVEDLGFHLVRVRYSGAGTGRSQLQIMAEPREDREMTVEDCEQLSRHVAALLDVDDPIASAYTLEVSSPGIDRPLTRIEDYDRFAGELAKLTLRFMHDGRKRFNGRLGGRDEDGKVIIETSFGRFTFAFDEIDSARIDPSEILVREAAARS